MESAELAHFMILIINYEETIVCSHLRDVVGIFPKATPKAKRNITNSEYTSLKCSLTV